METEKELWLTVLNILPDAEFDESGEKHEIVIYSGYYSDDDGLLRRLEDDELVNASEDD